MPSRLLSPLSTTLLLLLLLAGRRWSEAFSAGTADHRVAWRHANADDAPLRLTVLSEQPLLLVTDETTPLLSETECRILRDGYRGETSQRADLHRRVVQSLQARLDRLLLRVDDETVVEPRFLDYPADGEYDASMSVETVAPKSADELLPDGLHLDTNNAFYFRYLTVLVYLSTSDSYGATTFPVVQYTHHNDRAWKAAHTLLRDQHHTRPAGDVDEGANAAAAVLEEAAVDLFFSGVDDSPGGLRILPRTGHAVIFSSLTPDGHPDPRTWHGAEHVYCDPKQALSFFYECPLREVTSRHDLGAFAHRKYQELLASTTPAASKVAVEQTRSLVV